MRKSGVWFAVMGLSWTASALGEYNFTHRPAPINDAQVTESPEVKPAGVIEIKQRSSRLQVGIDYTYLEFKPHGNPGLHGNLYGVQGLYDFRPMNAFYAGAKLAWKEGRLHGSTGKRLLLYIDAQERLGYTFATEKGGWLLSLYTGLGFRHMQEKFCHKAGGNQGFRYNEFYVPLGLMSDWQVSSWFAFGVGFTWMPQVFSTVAAAPIKGVRWTLANAVANFFVEVPFDFTLTKSGRFHIIFKPFYEHWQDGRSTTSPKPGNFHGIHGNTYNFWGVDLNFAYRF